MNCRTHLTICWLWCTLQQQKYRQVRTNHTHTHTHTHTFNGPLSGTTWVSRYQKGKTSLDFTEARDSEWQWHQLGHVQVCTSLQTDNHASTPPLSFLQARCPSCHSTNSIKALKVHTSHDTVIVILSYCSVFSHCVTVWWTARLVSGLQNLLQLSPQILIGGSHSNLE